MRECRMREFHSLVAFIAITIQFPTASAQFVQQGNKLVGAGAVGNTRQGFSVALSADGNTAIVGGDSDNGGVGAAWVYTRSNGSWSQQGAKLVGTGAVGNYQGLSVGLSGDGNTAIVGGLTDNGGVGAALVYARSSGVWNQQGSKLLGTGAVGTAETSVALSGDGNTAIVGGDGDNGGVGAAWVYTRSGGVWSQQGAKLVGTGAVGSAHIGISVGLSGDGNTAIVGGSLDNDEAGAAWVYTRSGGVWSQQGAKLVGTDATRGLVNQGRAVALSGDGNMAIVGGDGDNGDVGAAWVFSRSGGVWSQQGAKLVGTGGIFPRQGWSVALSADGDTALTGGYLDHSDNSFAGAAWVFTRSAGVWGQQGAKLVGAGADRGAMQGFSVALSADGYTAIIGGPGSPSDSGAAWVFVRPVVQTVPSIASDGVANGASFLPGIAPGAWIMIKGPSLSATTRTWSVADFVGNTLPTKLDGVSVTVNGKPAYVSFISPTQLNVLSPDDTTQGSVSVQLTTAQGKSNVVTATLAALSPALFTFSPQGGKYVAAVRADGAYLAPPNLISGLTTVPAKPGDIIILFGTGFGPTSPPVQIGQAINSSPLANQVIVRIGGVAASNLFAGIVSPGLCQFNVVVPDAPNGDSTVSVEIGGVSSQPNVFLNLQR